MVQDACNEDDALRQAYPRVRVEEDRIFIKDGAIWTSAGMSAVIDLALAMVEEDLGRDISRTVARQLVVYHRRAGGQSQHSTLLELEPKSDRVQSALAFAKRHLRESLSVEQLADSARLSPRQFSRVFQRETGKSPAKAVEQLRVEAARLMLEEGYHSVEDVVRETGFANRERLRRAFSENTGPDAAGGSAVWTAPANRTASDPMSRTRLRWGSFNPAD